MLLLLLMKLKTNSLSVKAFYKIVLFFEILNAHFTPGTLIIDFLPSAASASLNYRLRKFSLEIQPGAAKEIYSCCQIAVCSRQRS
jgi:hypothetical protein